jgi:hypothetical protein
VREIKTGSAMRANSRARAVKVRQSQVRAGTDGAVLLVKAVQVMVKIKVKAKLGGYLMQVCWKATGSSLYIKISRTASLSPKKRQVK